MGKQELIEQLKQRQSQSKASAAIAFLWKNVQGWPVEYVSENVSQFGYGPQEFLTGRVPYDSIVHPKDIDQLGKEVEEYSNSDAMSYTQHYRIVTKDGLALKIEDNTTVERDAEGRVLWYAGLLSVLG